MGAETHTKRNMFLFLTNGLADSLCIHANFQMRNNMIMGASKKGMSGDNYKSYQHK
jgi:hypothetical protein